MDFIALVEIGWYPWFDDEPATIRLSKYTDDHFCNIARILGCSVYHNYERSKPGADDFVPYPDARYGRDVYILCYDKVKSQNMFVNLAKAVEAHAACYEDFFGVHTYVKLLDEFPEQSFFGAPIYTPED